MTNPQLTKDYFSILEQCQDPDVAFNDSPMQKALASAWLMKLCGDIYPSNEDKQLRNLYLLELSKCIDQRRLAKHFQTPPPKGKLQPLEMDLKVKIDPNTIIEEMQAAAAELVPPVTPRNYQTHMSSKLFDDNRGACTYIAVSLGDPRDGPIWMKMGYKDTLENIKKEEDFDDSFCEDYEDDEEVNEEFLQQCLEETAKELSGQTQPGECPLLDHQLKLYEKFIRNYDSGNEARNLNERDLRTFLLINFQTDLVHAFHRKK
ncbi:uncharacterized protein LOC129948392 [Eupeodes corollae]|uniref:uncharacterized protein LOC129948392 n=1 Tax=Eupeodes corollae TaxID=290404 RepID=UPI00248FED65|nr:uncharacterized protein LOC129948392 [Eupeodes corollae]